MRTRTCILALGLSVCSVAAAYAIDLGNYGPTWPIAEPDFVEDLTNRVAAKVDSGEWAKIQSEAQQRILTNVRTPPPVEGLSVAQQARSWLFDPSIVLSESITDHEGRILFPAGLRVNPLEVVSLTEPLLFFDARDVRQIETAARLVDEYEGFVTPILVGGSWADLAQAWERQIFFDQQGVMVARLGIERVPTLVTQDGMALRLTEVPVGEVPAQERAP